MLQITHLLPTSGRSCANAVGEVVGGEMMGEKFGVPTTPKTHRRPAGLAEG
jgi:hypothetical protein